MLIARDPEDIAKYPNPGPLRMMVEKFKFIWFYTKCLAVLLAIVALFDFVINPFTKWIGDKINDGLYYLFDDYYLTDTQAGIAFWVFTLIILPTLFLLRRRIGKCIVRVIKRTRQSFADLEAATRPE